MSDNGKWIALAARLGYGARGIVMLLVGGLAVLGAFGRGGGTTGSKGALQTLIAQPFGAVILAGIAFGLLCFAGWRFIQAATDPDRQDDGAKAVARRVARGISGVIHLGLAIFAASLALGRGGSADDEGAAQDWTAWLMSQPAGVWLVGLAGAAVIVAGLAMIAKGWTAGFRRDLVCDAATARWVVPLGRVGYIARGVVFGVIGTFLVIAAWQADPSEAKGLGGALASLEEQPFGWAVFTVTALGLAAFGLYGFVEARYRQVRVPDSGDLARAVPRPLR
jgi:hypothetical protein